ncbi:MAG: asparaginase domain-containing protein [Desulfofustis sp.]|jgi:L-asparaginase
MENILILTTGGTIDKIYFDANSTYEVGPPNISTLLAELNLSISYRIVPVLRKDSLDLTDDDRQLIYHQAAACEETRILITHGTDTMIETGAALQTIPGKTIVLTGALQPALFKTSDALFNIGCGLAAVQTLDSGVYIAMSGRIFECSKVRKNHRTHRFEPLD